MSEILNRNSIIPSILLDDTILATGPFAISLYNKGYYGISEEAGLRLNGFEALHLLELGRIEVKNQDSVMEEKDLVYHFSQIIANFMLRYMVYKDLRNRGYILNIGTGSSFFFRLYARNSIPKVDGAKYYVTPLQEGGSILLNELEDLIEIANKSSKVLLLAAVDSVGDVSYLEVDKLVPKDISQTKKFSDLTNWNWEDEWQDYLTWE